MAELIYTRSTEMSNSPSSPPPMSPLSSPLPSPSSLPELNPNHADGCCSDELMIQNHGNLKRSAAPVRIMFYREGCWEDYQSEMLEPLRSGFVEGKPVTELVIGEAKCAVDFVRMVQVDLGSGSHRSIAWFDEKGKPFFPKQFLDGEIVDGGENLRIEIEVRAAGEPDDKGKRKSEELGVDGSSGSKRVRLTSVVVETSQFPYARLLSKNDKAYSYLSNLFLSKMAKIDRGAAITAIHEFQLLAPFARARWEVVERQIEITKAARGEANVVYAWYAATAETAASVFSNGFGLSPVYGAGIFLSHVDSPHLSAMQSGVDNNGEKHIILCRVVLGNVETVEIEAQQTCPSRADFDTGSDDPHNPKWYVVWSADMNRRILPVCVFSCKTSALVPGQLRSSSGKKQAIPTLILELKKRIHSSKLQALVTLYDTFKARKLDKEIFIKQLRAITGDELLKSVFKEISSSG